MPSDPVSVPRDLLQRLAADLWAWHNDDEGCDGTCEAMLAVRQANDLLAARPAPLTFGTYAPPSYLLSASSRWSFPGAV